MRISDFFHSIGLFKQNICFLWSEKSSCIISLIISSYVLFSWCFYNIFHMLSILDWFIYSFSYFSFSFASFLGTFFQNYILNLSCSYFCYLIFSFYKLFVLLCIFQFYSITQCLFLHYWKYLWDFGFGVFLGWEKRHRKINHYYLKFLLKTFRKKVHFHVEPTWDIGGPQFTRIILQMKEI